MPRYASAAALTIASTASRSPSEHRRISTRHAYHAAAQALCPDMHGPSALPLIVELAATAVVVAAAIARRPVGRVLRAAAHRARARRRAVRRAALS
jgi:hypothetical protein